MRSRGLVVAIAIVLAVAAAAAVVLYTQGVKDQARGDGEQTKVIVSSQDIPANQNLDPLIDQGIFLELEVPRDALVGGAVTDVTQLQGVTTTTPILANEQISTSRLSTGKRPNVLGISEGHVAVSVEMDAPQGGVGNVQPGDHVMVFATYQGASVIPGTLKQYIKAPATASAPPQKQLPAFTLTLIPTAGVLKIQNPSVDVESGRSDSSRIQVTLDLLPQDAQNLVFAQENARIWLGLLPPDEEGTQPPASSVPIDILLGAKRG